MGHFLRHLGWTRERVLAFAAVAIVGSGVLLGVQTTERYPTPAVFTPDDSPCLNVTGGVRTEYGVHHVNASPPKLSLPEVWSGREPINGVVVEDDGRFRFRAHDGTEFEISPNEWSVTLDCPIG